MSDKFYFAKLIGIAVLAYVIFALRRGEIRDGFTVYSRTEDPFCYWLIISIFFGMAFLFLLVSIRG
jgi:uncharacterized protein with PQ loop repeat